MNSIGAWEINEDGPVRIKESNIDLEEKLEDWICRDPAIIQAGLTIIARQLVVEGGRLDLLAIDPQGRWVVIEIKRGTLMRETIAQTLDYAACIAEMAASDIEEKVDSYLLGETQSLSDLLEERDAQESLDPIDRDVSMIIVGTGQSSGLNRIVNFLGSKYNIPITLVTLHVLISNGKNILLRELNEPDIEQKPNVSNSLPANELMEKANAEGSGLEFRKIYEKAIELSIYPRCFKKCIMYAPPYNKARCLFTVWTKLMNNKVKMYCELSYFADFLGVNIEEVENTFGPDEWKFLDAEEVDQFIENLEKTLSSSKKDIED